MSISHFELYFRYSELIGIVPKTRECTPANLIIVNKSIAALHVGDYRYINEILRTLGQSAYRNFLDSMLDSLDESGDHQRWMKLLKKWCCAEPDNFHAQIALSMGLMHKAWRFRSNKTPLQIESPAGMHFFAALNEADRRLQLAQKMRPTHPEPLSLRLVTARGLCFDLPEVKRRFNALISLNPFHYHGHVAMLEYLKAKWCGSHLEMLAFARERISDAPLGNNLHILIVHAHWEMRNMLHWLNEPKADAYFQDKSVAEEVLQAFNRSLGHSQYVFDNNSREVANLFNATLSLCGFNEQAKLALEKLNRRSMKKRTYSMVKNTRENYNTNWILNTPERA